MTKGKTQKIHSFHKHNAHFDNNFTTVFNTQFDNKLCGSLQKNAGDDARSAQFKKPYGSSNLLVIPRGIYIQRDTLEIFKY
jgi:hypothetical protein